MNIRKSWLRKLGLLASAVILFGGGFLLGTTHPSGVVSAQGGADTQKAFAPFWQVWNLVHENYVDIAKIDDQVLVEGAMTGMVAALGDRHSAYMNADLYKRMLSSLAGTYEGIGASVKKDEATGGLQIISTRKGSPAREKLKVGDIVVTVEGEDITGQTETQIIGKVRGPAGTPVKLGIVRAGEKKIIEVSVMRAAIKIELVTAEVFDGGIGYISLAEFSDGAESLMADALKRMDADHLNGLIFDLRGDPGGGLLTAINVASLFIEKGPIVIQQNKPGVQDVTFNATGIAVATKVPMVVLVNGASASASELVSGALKDYKRAIIVGTNSFGKGSVQTWRDITDGGGLKITIAHFVTPKGNTVNKVGIAPDVKVEWDEQAQPDYDPQLAEALAILRKKMF